MYDLMYFAIAFLYTFYFCGANLYSLCVAVSAVVIVMIVLTVAIDEKQKLIYQNITLSMGSYTSGSS